MSKATMRDKIRVMLQKNSSDSKSVVSFVNNYLKKICAGKSIAVYAAMTNEITLELEDLLKICKVSLPRSKNGFYELAEIRSTEHLSKARLDILEPNNNCRSIDPTTIDLWIIPALAYDQNTGARLGHGCGYYDRLTENTPGEKIGVIYDFQLAERVPTESWDLCVNTILTNKQIIRIKD